MLDNAWILAKKDMKLLFKSTRRIFLLFSTPVIILIVVIFMAFFISIEIQGATDVSEGDVDVLIIQDDQEYNGTHWGNQFYSLLKTQNSTKNYNFINKSINELDDLLENRKFLILVYIPANFSELINQSIPARFYLYYDNDDLANEVLVSQISDVAYLLNQQLIYMEYGGPIILNRVYTLPQGISKGSGALIASFLTMIPLYAILMLVVPSLTLVLISVTIEREQKTLESLLLQPLERKGIIAGKLLYGMILVAVNTGSLILVFLLIITGFYLILPGDAREGIITVLETVVESAGHTVWLFIIYILIGLVLISLLMVAAAVFFSMMAKDEREANMVVSGLIVLPMVAIFLLIFMPLADLPQIVQLVIVTLPLLGFLFGIYLAILTGEMTLYVWLGLGFQAVWIVIAVLLAAKLIESEGILEISYKRLFRFRKRK
ncbi:MAG: ABC transporter permease [Candidatus Odinarchaeota archaeon]